jgi:hypothetical protein
MYVLLVVISYVVLWNGMLKVYYIIMYGSTVVLHVLYCKAARMHLPTNRASASLKGTVPYIVSWELQSSPRPLLFEAVQYSVCCMWEVGSGKKQETSFPRSTGHGPPRVEITGPSHE